LGNRYIFGNIVGGLGNQMFQYAFYKYLSLTQNLALHINISDFSKYRLHNGFELEDVFELNIGSSIPHSYLAQYRLLRFINKSVWKTLSINADFGNKFYSEKNFKAPSYIFQDNNKVTFFDGYYQSPKFIQECNRQGEKIFKFRADLTDLEKSLLANESVAIHVRGGDYVTSKTNCSIFGGICDNLYYERAMDYIARHVTTPKFVVFTNDIKYAEAVLPKGYNYKIPSLNQAKDSHRDMLMMANCRHNIIANSSFSWWGAYLNSNPSKCVIAPMKWFNSVEYDQASILPSDWVRL
jgi:hypothetical protein